MYLARWQAESTDSSRRLSPLAGLRDASTRWIVTHDIAEWKDEITWMSLYFSVAVWASLALCVCYSFAVDLPLYRIKAPLASRSSNDLINASAPYLSTYTGGLRPRFTTTAMNVRFGSKADIAAHSSDVRFTPKSGHWD